MYKQFINVDGEDRVVFTSEDFSGLQNHYIKKIIRHTHSVIPSRYVKIAEAGDTSPPVGMEIPLDGSVKTWQDHVNLTHSLELNSGQLLARGYTVPIKVRCIITTPIYDTTAKVPFPTYNMSNLTINKDLSSSEMRELVSNNRHNPSTYTNYRHYLWIMPMNSVSHIHPSHLPILEPSGGIRGALFAKQPLFIHNSNTEFLKSIQSPVNTPNFRSLPFVPDYAEEKIWSLVEDSSCILGGYKSIVTNGGKEISLFFNDMYSEFSQIMSLVNYEELNREYYFKLEKGGGNLTRSDYNSLSDLTRLMEAKALDTLDINSGSGLVRDSINKKINPYAIYDYNFKINNNSERLKSNLLDSTVEKNGDTFTFFTKGLPNFATINGVNLDTELTTPLYFDEGRRQCLVINAEFGTSKRSFKKLHKGKIALIYQIIDGFVTVPYEIYSVDASINIGRSTQVSEPLLGSISEREYIEVIKTPNNRNPGFPNGG